MLNDCQCFSAFNQYMGCFIDRIGDRDLNIFMTEHVQLSVQQCIDACRIEHFLYAGIQYGSECRCDNQFGKYGQVSDTECYHRCSEKDKCGGIYRNSVYHVTNRSGICSNRSVLT
jgi:hypothetical protein